MASPIQSIRDRIEGKKANSDVENVVAFMRELGGVGDIVGRDFEVLDPDGKLIATIRMKPMPLAKFNILLKALARVNERESKAVKKRSRR